MIFLDTLSPNAQGLLIFCVFTAIGAGLCAHHSKWLKQFWIKAGRPTQVEAPEYKDWRIWRNHSYAIATSTFILIIAALAMPGK
jgi:hypothetical protein